MPSVGSKKVLLASLFFLLLIALFYSPVFASQSDAETSISSAKKMILGCYNAAKNAETAGANITTLTGTLNEAGLLLSKAELTYSKGDFDAAASLAVQSQNKLNNLIAEANSLRANAAKRQSQDFLVNMVGSLAGAFIIVGAGACVWVILKRRSETAGADASGSSKI